MQRYIKWPNNPRPAGTHQEHWFVIASAQDSGANYTVLQHHYPVQHNRHFGDPFSPPSLGFRSKPCCNFKCFGLVVRVVKSLHERGNVDIENL